MSKIGGINKMMNTLNRNQQKRDWLLLLHKLGNKNPLPLEPDWSKSVKKIDEYIMQVCCDNSIKFRHICGLG